MKKGVIPPGSKLLAKKWRAIDYENHMQRLKQVKPTLNHNPPNDFNHLRSKAKRERMLEEKYIEIERENKILLHKMQKILKTSSS